MLTSFFDCFPGANSENNFYRQTENTDWTEGFWTGELWLAYESNKDDKLKEAALLKMRALERLRYKRGSLPTLLPL